MSGQLSCSRLPLRKDLPGFLTKWCVRTPPITVLLPILIREHGFKAAAMEVELDHISGAEAEGGQGGEKELVDHSLAGHANRTGSGPGWMRGDDHARAMSLRGHRQFSTLKQVPADPTFRMHELLIGRQGETGFDLCQIKEPVIFATHQPGDPCLQQIGDDGPVPVLAIESDEGLTCRQAQLRLIRHDHLQPSQQLPSVVCIARIPKRPQPLMSMSLQECRAGTYLDSFLTEATT